MLDKQDLQAIKELIDESVTASEARTQAKLDAMGAKIDASEDRTQAKIDASENRIMAYIEAAVMPKFQILAEGHQNILDTLAPKSRVEALEDEVVFIKSVMKAMSQEIAELKKAQ